MSKELENFLNTLNHAPFLLILDTVQDPHNLGACLRTANAAAVDALIIPKDKSVGLTDTVKRVACGAAEVTPVFSVTNLARTLEMLKKQGIWLYGTSDNAKESVYDQKFSGAIALIMGNEGSGLRRLTQELCDFHFKIPMHGTVECLNVSVATGICLFEIVRQKGFL